MGTEECHRCVVEDTRHRKLKAAAADGAGTGTAVHAVPSKSAHTAQLERRSATTAETRSGAYGVMEITIGHLGRRKQSVPVLDAE